MNFCLVFIFLLGPARCANILGVFMYPSFSHQIIYRQITKELSLRGHKVTVLTPNPANDSALTNLTEVDVGFVYEVLQKNNVHEKYSKDLSAVDYIKNLYTITDIVAELELNNTKFQKLISDKNQNFDLILIHVLHPVMHDLGERFKAPVISISTLNIFSATYDLIGNPNHPVLFPDLLFTFRPGNLTLWEKIQSIYFMVWLKWYYRWDFQPRIDQMARKYFGDVPYIGDLQKNVAMLFIYRNILMEPRKPNVPGVLDFSLLNVEPPKSLPDDLQKTLDEATEGVVYISFGSNIKTDRLKESVTDSILKALPELPYTVLLKWDTDDFPSSSPNVVARKWYPQRDLLAHPNVKVFVTQGGLQSIEDAIMRGVPLIGVPFISDQPKNVRRFAELGIGDELDPDKINKDLFKNVIIKVAEDICYKEKINTVRKILLDKSMTGLENVVWWCEYVIRHKGAKHLRSTAVDISYANYFLLDLISLSIILCILIVFCVKLISKKYMC